MSLLKGTEGKPKKPMVHPGIVAHWPERGEGLGFSVKDGWHFGIGVWLALLVGMPLILGVGACLFYVVIAILGVSLGSL